MWFLRGRSKLRLLILALIGLGFLLVIKSNRKPEIKIPITTTTLEVEVTNATTTPTTTTTEEPFIPKRENETIILLWSKYFNKDPPLASWNEQLKTCSSNCRIVSKREYLIMSDAVLFHGQDLNKEDLPIPRAQNQMWVFLDQTPSDVDNKELEDFPNIFNWTMTYRQDSDIVFGFGSMKQNSHQGQTIEGLSIKEIVSNKTKLVAYLSDKCDTSSKREEYVALLADYVPVDIYGYCGDLSCEDEDKGCLNKISEHYKFYLSFEESLCKDYISERFYNPLQHIIVPVVYGGADYAAKAPPNSYINIKDFLTSKMLADFLVHLDKEVEGYLEYFEWKDKFHYEPDTAWCDLCNKLQQPKERNVEKVYSNLWEWWFRKEGEEGDKIDICEYPPYDVF